MTQTISRSEFLQGRFSAKNRPLRPPWSIAAARFLELCNQCGDCIKKCPTGIIQSGRGNYPLIDFNKGECLFCANCVDVCQTDALKRDAHSPAWSISASIDSERCLAYKSVECRSCFDPCEQRAIEMRYRVGSVAIPLLDTQRCNGCGACYSPCPVNAIEMQNSVEVAA
ncbi:MAG: ferredoxin-type protein NapF [Gammaproteobacteria bacterium]|nr:ferredoxin-type protein NapF [Gammaproteobacteria bacterium]